MFYIKIFTKYQSSGTNLASALGGLRCVCVSELPNFFITFQNWQSSIPISTVTGQVCVNAEIGRAQSNATQCNLPLSVFLCSQEEIGRSAVREGIKFVSSSKQTASSNIIGFWITIAQLLFNMQTGNIPVWCVFLMFLLSHVAHCMYQVVDKKREAPLHAVQYNTDNYNNMASKFNITPYHLLQRWCVWLSLIAQINW